MCRDRLVRFQRAALYSGSSSGRAAVSKTASSQVRVPPGVLAFPYEGRRNSRASGRESSRSRKHPPVLRLSVKLNAWVLLIFDIFAVPDLPGGFLILRQERW